MRFLRSVYFDTVDEAPMCRNRSLNHNPLYVRYKAWRVQTREIMRQKFLVNGCLNRMRNLALSRAWEQWQVSCNCCHLCTSERGSPARSLASSLHTQRGSAKKGI